MDIKALIGFLLVIGGIIATGLGGAEILETCKRRRKIIFGLVSVIGIILVCVGGLLLLGGLK